MGDETYQANNTENVEGNKDFGGIAGGTDICPGKDNCPDKGGCKHGGHHGGPHHHGHGGHPHHGKGQKPNSESQTAPTAIQPVKTDGVAGGARDPFNHLKKFSLPSPCP